MDDSILPTFPEFKWDGYFWVTSAKLAAWSGYQVRYGPYGDVSDDNGSDGTIKIVFAPEGRGKGVPLTAHEIELVKWVVDHQAAVHDAAIGKLFEEYPGIREEALEWFDSDEAARILPKVNSREQLKALVK